MNGIVLSPIKRFFRSRIGPESRSTPPLIGDPFPHPRRMTMLYEAVVIACLARAFFPEIFTIEWRCDPVTPDDPQPLR